MQNSDNSSDQIQVSCPVIGIDLGTSNSVLSYWTSGLSSPQILPVRQILDQGLIGEENLLPSVLYLPTTEEKKELVLDAQGWIGRGAKIKSTLVPDRAVVSAKSWLTETRMSRTDAILPWRSAIDPALKVSPVEASRRFLSYLRQAYFEREKLKTESEIEPELILTVPASFDEVARSLTCQAAAEAGFKNVTLLEEPLAAFYAWIDTHLKSWRDVLKPGDVILICDIGGGTSDFSLVYVTEDKRPGHLGELHLERISVGEHLLLGGDNMDLALAARVRERLRQDGHEIDEWQFLALRAQARDAKEKLLEDGSEHLEQVPVSVASRGSSLFKKSVSSFVSRSDIQSVLIDGFFPFTSVYDEPQKRRFSGIQELGLRYESDPVLSRHLARFLRRSLESALKSPLIGPELAKKPRQTHEKALLPQLVLFNGGVFKSKVFQNRVLEILKQWTEELGVSHEIHVLETAGLDISVAYGAATYGKLRATGKGIRVQAGLARSYYIGLEPSMPALPTGIAYEPPIQGLCLVAQGTSEGTQSDISDQEFGLVVGETVDFRFFSSNIRPEDQPGSCIDKAKEYLEETSRLQATLTPQGYQEGEIIPVRLKSFVTETGTLQLSLHDPQGQKSWKLEFDVRESL